MLTRPETQLATSDTSSGGLGQGMSGAVVEGGTWLSEDEI